MAQTRRLRIQNEKAHGAKSAEAAFASFGAPWFLEYGRLSRAAATKRFA
jgi:hypothetical protein